MTTKGKLARWISIVGHPFTFVVLLVATASWRLHGRHEALRTTIIVVAATLVPLGLFILNRYSSGRWVSADASAPAERRALYKAMFLVLIPAGLYFIVRERGSDMLRGLIATALLIATAALLNHWIKVSLHVTVATFAAVIITKLLPIFGGMLLAFLPLLAWSRLTLSRHSILEVLAGLALGLTVAAVTLWR